MKFIILIIALLIPVNAWAECEKPLIWSHSLSAPLYKMQSDGGITGFSADIVQTILDKSGCKFIHKISSWSRSLKDIEKGKVDFIADASKTPERQKWGWFTEPYYIESIVLFFRQNDTAIADFDSLTEALEKGLRIGIGSQKYWVGEEFEQIKKSGKYKKQLVFVNNLKSQTSLFKLLERNRIDLAISSKIGGSYLAKSIGANVSIYSYVLAKDPWHLLLSKKSVSKATFSILNAAIIELKKSGEMQSIIDRYLN